MRFGWSCVCGALWKQLGLGLWQRDRELGGDPGCAHRLLSSFRYVEGR